MGKKYYLDFIDGAKGIAILLVILVHVSGLIHEGSYTFLTSARFLQSGARGVQLLFMISAFTLMNSNTIKFQNRSMNLKAFAYSFYKRRIVRLWPLWILGTIVGILLHPEYNLITFFASATFLFGFLRFLPNMEAVVGGWAVFAELVFYLTFPLVFFYVKDIKTAMKFMTLTVMITMAWRFIVRIMHIPTYNAFDFLFPLNHAYSFGLGIIFYYLWKQMNILEVGRVWVNIWTILGSFLLLSHSYDLSTLGIFIIFICTTYQDSAIGSLARLPILKQLGKISYPVFLFHFFIIEITERKLLTKGYLTLGTLPNEIRVLIWTVLIGVICMGLGIVLYRYFEQPILNNQQSGAKRNE